MFTCPYCQFENPIQNRFCQRCGNPLRELRAIVIRSIAPPKSANIQDTSSDSATLESVGLQSVNDNSAIEIALEDVLSTGNYLDQDKRYQLRQPIKSCQGQVDELELAIVDGQPAVASPIGLMAESAAVDPDSSSLETALPSTAYPYWKLQEQFFPVIPELHAAWKNPSFTVLVIEDRSSWGQLSEAWGLAEEPLELIHWLYEMVDLWDSLVEFEVEPSLLNPQNLLIDDDQILCLRRLFYRSSDRTYGIKDLGLFWQSLLQQLTNEQFSALEKLAIDMGAGRVADVAAIKEHLANIADAIQEKSMSEAPLNAEVFGQREQNEAPPVTLPDYLTSETEEKPAPMGNDLLQADTLEAAASETSESSEESISELPTMTLPMKLYRLDEAGRTHVGRQRLQNEDSFYTETDLRRIDNPSGPILKAKGLYILCDGMGGNADGEVASALAVDTLRNYFETHWQSDLPDEATIKTGILQANQVIFEKNETEGRTGNRRMGTTLVMVLLADNHIVVAHVGDSRLYCFTRQGLKQATIDHEVGQREINRGVEPAIAYARPDAYQLTQALGPRKGDEILPSVNSFYIGQDTLLLLCSDGLSDNDLVENCTKTHVAPLLRSRADLSEGVADLIDLANEHNGHDNITAVVIRIKVRPNLEAAKEQL